MHKPLALTSILSKACGFHVRFVNPFNQFFPKGSVFSLLKTENFNFSNVIRGGSKSQHWGERVNELCWQLFSWNRRYLHFILSCSTTRKLEPHFFCFFNAECECGYCVLFIIFEKGMCTATFTYDNFNSIDNSFLTQTKIINLAAY